MIMVIMFMMIMIMVRCQRNYMLVAQGGGEGEWGGSSRDEEGSREGSTLGELSMEGMMRKMIIRKMDTALRITKRNVMDTDSQGGVKREGERDQSTPREPPALVKKPKLSTSPK